MLFFELFPALLMVVSAFIGVGLFVANRRANASDEQDARQTKRAVSGSGEDDTVV